MIPPDGFTLPDLHTPLDVDALVRSCPPDATTKGMFFMDIVEQLKKHGVPLPDGKRYHLFSDYPQREFLVFAAKAAKQRYPGLTQREALRRLGEQAYPTFASTTIGRVMFGIVGNDVSRILRVAPKAYGYALSLGAARMIEIGARHAQIELVDVHTYVDSYQLGVWEGAVRACGQTPTIAIKLHSPVHAELWIEW